MAVVYIIFPNRTPLQRQNSFPAIDSCAHCSLLQRDCTVEYPVSLESQWNYVYDMQTASSLAIERYSFAASSGVAKRLMKDLRARCKRSKVRLNNMRASVCRVLNDEISFRGSVYSSRDEIIQLVTHHGRDSWCRRAEDTFQSTIGGVLAGPATEQTRRH